MGKTEQGLSFTKIFRVLVGIDKESRVNLFEVFPRLRAFFANRHNVLFTRTFGDIVFTFLILLGLFGPQDPSRNISLFISWGLWWTSVVLSWFFVGKLWCGFCPFPGLGRLFQTYGLSLKLEVPQSLNKVFAHLSVILLGLIIWIESVTYMKDWPAGTAYLLLSILLGATLMGIIFKGQAWCRHACPLGKIIGSAATIAVTEFRSDRIKCQTCRTMACKLGVGSVPGCPINLGATSVRSNFYCLVCGHCVMLCKRHSPGIYLRNPFIEITSHIELTQKKATYLTYSYIIPFFMGSQLARFIQYLQSYQSIKAHFFGSNLIAFTALLAAGFLFFIAVIRIGSSFFISVENDVFGLFSPMVPALVPLAFTGELAYRLEYLLSHIGNFLPTFGRQFGIGLEALSFNVPVHIIYSLCMLVLTLGALAGNYVLHIFYKRNFIASPERINYIAINILITLIFLIYIILFGIPDFTH
ncbi:MAG: 4Fe-4S binding protein [Dissulfurispiraceae bacterium]|jgi:hypothetical protein